METRRLPNTDLTVSRACFGTMTFGMQNDQQAADRLIDLCLDRGVNFFDTANVYSTGVAETMLGVALKGRRDKVIVASKVRMRMGGGPDESGLSRAAIFKAVDESLARLQTDYLDIYFLHAPDWETPIEETLEAMDRLVRTGKVRYPGTSNYAAWQICEMHWIAKRNGYLPAYISQPMYNMVARGIEQEYLAMCKRFGVSNVVYNPLAAGLLTGKQRREAPIPGSRFDLVPMHRDRFWHPEFFDALGELNSAAVRAGRSMTDVSLSWLLHHTPTDCIILGASNEKQLAENLDAFEKSPLPEEVIEVADCVWQKLRGVTPKYNR
jgi:aryl-alcohol dehydrogenase-like predicted oxidoreductase